MAPSPESVRLARRLRDLRESQLLTQKDLSRALSSDTRVAVATISSWESHANPKLPPEERLRSYALLFAASSVPDTVPREHELEPADRERFNQLHRELIGLRDEIRHHQTGAPTSSCAYTFEFESGPVTLEAGQAQDAWRDHTPRELVEDVGLLARLPNPFNHSRTITICNGVYSRGVLGAVRTLTDDAVRERNEAYLANRFPGGVFGLLLRVPVVNGEAITPDLEISENRLFEWSPEDEGT